MKKIERRAFVCLALALLLAAGLGFFLVKYFLDGGSWASSAFNRHLYNSSGQLASGTVLDRDGDVLSEVVDGQRTYYDNATVRKATLHAVGDLQGNIGTGALNAFADKLTGYSLLNGAFGAQRGNDLYLTIDARYNYTAYEALGGKSGTVAVYNYETGEILCMVSAPSYDPLNVPEDITTNDRYKGAYLNRFLSSTFTPGSVYKTVTLAAALEDIPDLADRTWTCSGSVQMGDETIICSGTHGEQDIASAFANSCNVAFAQIAQELGPGTLEKYTEQAGLTGSYSISGLPTAKGSFDFDNITDGQLGWAGVVPRPGEPGGADDLHGRHRKRRQGGGAVSDPPDRERPGSAVPAPLHHQDRHADFCRYGGCAGGPDGQQRDPDLRRQPLSQYGHLRQVRHG